MQRKSKAERVGSKTKTQTEKGKQRMSNVQSNLKK